MSDDPDSIGTEVEVSVLDHNWWAEFPSVENLSRDAAMATFKRALPEGFADCEISLVLADDNRVQALNRDYRGRDTATNVLAFANIDMSDAISPHGAQQPGPMLLGDVVLARQTLLREAAEQQKSPADHLCHLVVHGVLHLLGFDHHCADDAKRMESLEALILADLGVADPYAGDPVTVIPGVTG